MEPKTYCLIGGTIFGAVAIAHAIRLFLHLPVHVGTFEVPMEISWIGGIIAAVLCILGFTSARR